MNATTRKTVRRRLVQQPLLLPTHLDRVDHLAHKHVDQTRNVTLNLTKRSAEAHDRVARLWTGDAVVDLPRRGGPRTNQLHCS